MIPIMPIMLTIIIVCSIIWAWVGIEKLIERRRHNELLRELIEKNFGKTKKEN